MKIQYIHELVCIQYLTGACYRNHRITGFPNKQGNLDITLRHYFNLWNWYQQIALHSS